MQKIFKMKHTILYTLGVLLFLSIQYSCSSDVSAVIDNPTDADLTVILDGKTNITIPANSSKNHIFTPGDHKMKVESTGAEYNFGLGSNMSGAILNPTKSGYIVMETSYAASDIYQKAAEAAMKKGNIYLSALGMSIDGPYSKDSTFVIPRYWDYGVDENFPEQISISADASYSIQSKVYREADFMKELFGALFSNPELMPEGDDAGGETTK